MFAIGDYAVAPRGETPMHILDLLTTAARKNGPTAR